MYSAEKHLPYVKASNALMHLYTANLIMLQLSGYFVVKSKRGCFRHTISSKDSKKMDDLT